MPLTTTITGTGSDVDIQVTDGSSPGDRRTHVADVFVSWDPESLNVATFSPRAGTAVLLDQVQGVLIWFKQQISETGKDYTVKFGPIKAGTHPYVVVTATDSGLGQSSNEKDLGSVHQF